MKYTKFLFEQILVRGITTNTPKELGILAQGTLDQIKG